MNNFCISDALTQLLIKQLCFQFKYYMVCFPSVQICEKMNTWSRIWDDQQKVPYGCNGNQFVGYDDAESIKFKVRNSQTNKFYHIWIYASVQLQYLELSHHKNFQCKSFILHFMPDEPTAQYSIIPQLCWTMSVVPSTCNIHKITRIRSIGLYWS
jgi:hypothetical protein